MEFGGDIKDMAFMFTVAIAVGGLALAVLYPILNASKADRRVEQISEGSKVAKAGGFRARFAEDQKDTRRRQIQDSLKQIENDEKKRKKKLTLRP